MTAKKLYFINGLIGLIGGIVLLLISLFLPFIIISAAATNASMGGGLGWFAFALKLVILILAIYSLVTLSSDSRMQTGSLKVPLILLIVGSGVAMIPLLGWAGSIVLIIGGSIGLAKNKAFK